MRRVDAGHVAQVQPQASFFDGVQHGFARCAAQITFLPQLAVARAAHGDQAVMLARIGLDQPRQGGARKQRLVAQVMGDFQGLVTPEQRVAPGEIGQDAGHPPRLAGDPLTPLQGALRRFETVALAVPRPPPHTWRKGCDQRTWGG